MQICHKKWSFAYVWSKMETFQVSVFLCKSAIMPLRTSHVFTTTKASKWGTVWKFISKDIEITRSQSQKFQRRPFLVSKFGSGKFWFLIVLITHISTSKKIWCLTTFKASISVKYGLFAHKIYLNCGLIPLCAACTVYFWCV